MTSEEVSAWLLGEFAPEVQRHRAACAACREELESLRHTLAEFRDSGQRWSEYWYARPAEAAPRGAPVWRWMAAAGATVAAALLLLAPAAVRPEATPFVAIPYVPPPAPYEQARVVRMEVPVTALLAAGFEVHAPDLSGAVTMDVLVGQDGRAFAVRPASRRDRP